jgi:tetratricopeptide (TPR) repeat protein
MMSSANAQQYLREAEAYLQRGNEAALKGDTDMAADLYSRALVVYPLYTDALLARARIREKQGNDEGALLDYSLLLEITPEQFEVIFSRAVLRYQRHYYDLARQDFRKLLSLPRGETNTVYYKQSVHSPGTTEILTLQANINGQIYHYLGLIELAQTQCYKSIQFIDSAILYNPAESDFYLNRALAKQACRDSIGARQDFLLAMQINPDNDIARYNLATIARQQGSTKEAEAALSEIIAVNPSLAESYLERAYLRLQNRNYTGALDDYTAALKLEPATTDAWLNRGIVKEKLNDYAGAIRDLNRAIDLQPDYALAWLNRGNVFSLQQQYDRAIQDYTVAILYDPAYGAAYYNRALAYAKIGQNKSACQDMQKAERLEMVIDPSLRKKVCGMK